MSSTSKPRPRRRVWVFEPDADEQPCFYELEIPYSDDFAEALIEGDRTAWVNLLDVMHTMIARADEAEADGE